jgi:hypothetical protein
VRNNIQSFGGNEKSREKFYQVLVDREKKIIEHKWMGFRIGGIEFQVRRFVRVIV